MAALFITVTTGFDLNWVVTMIFIAIIGGIGTLEGPIVGTVIYCGIRELLTNVFALSGSWYLIALGSMAVLTMLVAPRAPGLLFATGSVSSGWALRVNCPQSLKPERLLAPRQT